MTVFDPNAAAAPGSGLFGLPGAEREAAIVIVPVPFAATVSYGGGAELAPGAILAASRQVDLYDLQFGRTYECGIHMLPADPAVAAAHGRARSLAQGLVARGGAPGAADRAAVAAVDAAGEFVNGRVRAETERLLAAGKVPGILGGDHSVPFGAIAAVARRHPDLGILHVDAHADLREAYEGFRWSHASIMHNVLREVPGLRRLVQVGVRDFCEQELRAVQASGGTVVTHFDQEWQRRRFVGEPFDSLCAEAVAALPRDVYVSFDVDGLDPALCPNTGTPVPGGFSFAEACHLLSTLVHSGRRIVAFDLVEVVPGANSDWDANVGARLLYKLCGAAAAGG
ncbi:MAG: agmatinase family protein [Planctomycetes bacterium]|nr:agmatinase family protein [Planctomycetota bacterium]